MYKSHLMERIARKCHPIPELPRSRIVLETSLPPLYYTIVTQDQHRIIFFITALLSWPATLSHIKRTFIARGIQAPVNRSVNYRLDVGPVQWYQQTRWAPGCPGQRGSLVAKSHALYMVSNGVTIPIGYHLIPCLDKTFNIKVTVICVYRLHVIILRYWVSTTNKNVS